MNWKYQTSSTSRKVSKLKFVFVLRNKSIFNVSALNFDIHFFHFSFSWFQLISVAHAGRESEESEKRDCWPSLKSLIIIHTRPEHDADCSWTERNAIKTRTPEKRLFCLVFAFWSTFWWRSWSGLWVGRKQKTTLWDSQENNCQLAWVMNEWRNQSRRAWDDHSPHRNFVMSNRLVETATKNY